jgi:hypothetical protein
MSGFTKGPWQIDVNNVHAGTVATVHRCTYGWADIWSDKWMEEGMGPEVMDANARLIAASPTMAEYLSELAAAGDKRAAEIMEAINASR